MGEGNVEVMTPFFHIERMFFVIDQFRVRRGLRIFFLNLFLSFILPG